MSGVAPPASALMSRLSSYTPASVIVASVCSVVPAVVCVTELSRKPSCLHHELVVHEIGELVHSFKRSAATLTPRPASVLRTMRQRRVKAMR
jgi:hypothetical protein